MRGNVETSKICSFLAVPLRVRDEMIGTLSVADIEGSIFTEAEKALLQTFADQAALALDHTRLYAQTRERLRHVEFVREVVEQVLAPSVSRSALNLIARKAAELFNADRVLVGLKPEGQDHSSSGPDIVSSRASSDRLVQLGEAPSARPARPAKACWPMTTPPGRDACVEP